MDGRPLGSSIRLDEGLTPGGEIVSEELTVQVVPQGADEFTCASCFLVWRRSSSHAKTIDQCEGCPPVSAVAAHRLSSNPASIPQIRWQPSEGGNSVEQLLTCDDRRCWEPAETPERVVLSLERSPDRRRVLSLRRGAVDHRGAT